MFTIAQPSRILPSLMWTSPSHPESHLLLCKDNVHRIKVSQITFTLILNTKCLILVQRVPRILDGWCSRMVTTCTIAQPLRILPSPMRTLSRGTSTAAINAQQAFFASGFRCGQQRLLHNSTYIFWSKFENKITVGHPAN